MPPKQIDISTLDPRQLQSIHEQIQTEMESLAQSSVALQRAAGEYGNSGRALEQLSEQKEGGGSLNNPYPAASNLAVILPSDVQINQCCFLSPQQYMSLASWRGMTPFYWTLARAILQRSATYISASLPAFRLIRYHLDDVLSAENAIRRR